MFNYLEEALIDGNMCVYGWDASLISSNLHLIAEYSISRSFQGNWLCAAREDSHLQQGLQCQPSRPEQLESVLHDASGVFHDACMSSRMAICAHIFVCIGDMGNHRHTLSDLCMRDLLYDR